MMRRIALRLGIILLTLLFVSLAVFLATEALPGDVAEAILGQSASPEAVAGLRQALHLDRPAWLRYLMWLGGLLTLDPGVSLVSGDQVAQMIGPRLVNSLKLAAVTAGLSVPIALALGITSAMKQGSLYDRIVNGATVAIVSVPEFLIATLAVMIFAVKLRWLPALSFNRDIHTLGQFLYLYAMPVISLTCGVVAQMARMTRAALADVLRAPFIEMAVLKGAGPIRVVLMHALPNAIGPIVNAVALSLSALLGGVVVIETIFSYPGVAKLMVDAVATRDMPLVQCCAMIFCAAYLLLVGLADIVAILTSPKGAR